MITADLSVFPNNIVELIHLRCSYIDSDLFITNRPLRDTDPVQAIGIFAAQWLPNEDSKEMSGGLPGPSEPTIQTYLVSVQSFVKDMDEERGLAVHSVLSKIIRSMLYRDEPLRVGLASLSVDMNGSTERTQRWGVRTQRYFSNEITGNWLYLSTLEFWLDTETV